MSAPPPAPLVPCSECGAENLPGHDKCWLCYRPLIVVASLVDERPAKPAYIPESTTGSNLLWGAAAVTLILVVLVGVGAFATDSGLGIAYCVVVTPALAIGSITFAVTHHRQQSHVSQGGKVVGQATPVGTRSSTPVAAGLASFFTSLAITAATLVVAAAILVLVAVAAVIALIATCFASLAQMGQ